MALAGEGAVAIWHDIAPEGREGFYAWHGEEHMPERVGIPGFVRGRRYDAVAADREYFNLYEALSPQVLTGTDYRARLEAPTPWTVATVAHFRNVARSICRVVASHGKGCGGLAATLRCDLGEEEAEAAARKIAEDRLPRLAAQRGVAGAHVLVADAAASRHDTAEKRARNGGTETPDLVVIVEGWGDEAPFRDLVADWLGDGSAPALGLPTGGPVGLYRLQNARLKTGFSAG